MEKCIVSCISSNLNNYGAKRAQEIHEGTKF